jgi:hypothetical protein
MARGKLRGSITLATTLSTVGLVIGMGASTAAADEVATAGRYCVEVVGKAPSGPSAISPTIAEACSDVSEQDAEAKLNLPSAGTSLVRLWQNSGYGGVSKLVIGYEGTCDSAGYTFNIGSSESLYHFFTDELSSISKFGDCTAARLTNFWADNIWRSLPVDGLPQSHNDDVEKLHLYRK